MADNTNAPKPTGCFKCGLPGHWSRDCTLSKPNSSNPNSSSNPNPNSSSNPNPNPNPNRFPFKNTKFPSKFPSSNQPTSENPIENPKKVIRKVKPKLTPETLLSENGLGYILRHFPKAFKFHGKGHEVADLGNLIELYSQWHSRLMPYYSFEQFIHKVEQVGATKRVRTCLRDLRDRVANGGDPSKLHEAPVEHSVGDVDPEEVRTDDPFADQNLDVMEEEIADEMFANVTEVPDNGAGTSSGSQITEEQRARIEANQERARQKLLEKTASQKNPPPVSQAVDDEVIEEEMLDEEMPDEIYANATEEPIKSAQNQTLVVPENPDDSNESQLPDIAPENGVRVSGETNTLTEEQRARIEANRLKALERAAARTRALSAD
ncbi:hypothetical protein ACHQM5_005194 [Ranunculus cassubicifolius]